MTRVRGSWPPIVILAVSFLVLFAWQRHRSPFLAIEAERAAAAAVAAPHGLTVFDAMALRELLGVDRSPAEWAAAAATFAKLRPDLGDPLAAIAVAGEPALADATRRAAPSADAAWLAFRTDPRAIAGLRFLAMRDRFASRDRPRD